MPQVGFEPTISAGERPQTYCINSNHNLIFIQFLPRRKQYLASENQQVNAV